MHTLVVNPHFDDTVDLLALAFGVLHVPTPNNSIKANAESKVQDERYDCPIDDEPAPIVKDSGEIAQYVLFNPLDYHLFVYHNQRLVHHLDRETMQKLVRRGIVGYLWGATVVLDTNVARGYVVVSADSRENALKSDKSIVVEISKQEIPDRAVMVSKADTDWSSGPCPVSQDPAPPYEDAPNV